MANEVVREVNPIVSPDSIRASLNFLKAFNETHTKRFCSREDADGCKYIGTTENFGDEILIESRKLKMEKPSLKRLFKKNTFEDYFDIDFSDLMESYYQQNMLIALLKKDVLIKGSEYILKFEGCTKEEVIRSKNYKDSDDVAESETFYTTTTPPTLVINELEEVPLELTFGDESENTVYMFYDSLATHDMIDDITEENDSYKISVNVTQLFENLPFVWITNKTLFHHDIQFESGEIEQIRCPDTLDVPNTLLWLNMFVVLSSMSDGLKIGTGGDGQLHVYFKGRTYENCDYYSQVDHVPGDNVQLEIWAHAANENYEPDYVEEGSSKHTRVSQEVDKIFITLAYTNSIAKPGKVYFGTRQIYNFDRDKVKINVILDQNYRYAHRTDYWDYETASAPFLYDNNLTETGYYKVSIPFFEGNNNEEKWISVFDVHLKNDGEEEIPFNDCKNAVSGIHIDAGTDYTTHGVIKDQGLVYNFDKFDGLPNYLKSLYDRNLHRSHVEVYTIRDRKYHNTITKKQTAALILDSGTPITKLREVDGNAPIIIYYDSETQRFKSRIDDIIDKDNCVSEINYVSGNLFSNMNIPMKNNYPKFVYHGNNYFSLGLSAFDRDKEIARVYIITNDSIKYENNELVNRPGRTFARICDIPTDFTQLIHIKNAAPTIIFDMNYCRTEVSNNEFVLDLLYNKRTLYSAFTMIESGGLYRPHSDTFIMPYNEVGPRVWFRRYDLEKKYGIWDNFGQKADLTSAVITIEDSGESFAVDDTFYFMIGGRSYDCTVTEVDANGGIIDFDVELTNENREVDPNNLDGYESIIGCVKRLTESDSDISVSIVFDQTYWDTLFIEHTDVIRKWTHTYQYDETGNIWIWSYDDETSTWIKEVQVTGAPITPNDYDIIDRKIRSFNDAMLFNMTKPQHMIDSKYVDNQYAYRSIYQFDIPYESGFDPTIDIIEDLQNHNIQSGIYTVMEDLEEHNNGIVCQFNINPEYTYKNHQYEVNKYVIPRYNELNLSNFHNYSNKFMIINNNSIQPDLCLFFPSRNYHRYNSGVGYVTDGQYNITHYAGEITYADMLYNDEDLPVDWIRPDKTTISPIYHYNEYKIPEDIKNEITRLKVSNRQYLINFCVSRFNMNLEYAEKLTRDQLFTYAVTHMHMQNGLIYKRDGINKDHSANDKVLSNPVNSKPKGEGLQPSGDFLNISTNDMDIEVKIDYTDGYDPPLYIFELDDEEDRNMGIDPSYRIFDECDNDITDLSVIIKVVTEGELLRRIKYIFRNNRWISVVK